MNPRTPNPDQTDPTPGTNPDVTPDKPMPGGGVESPGDAQRPGTPPGTTTS